MAIWLITGALDTITASLLALMGISAGTALGEAMIDNGKDTAKTNQTQDLTAEKQALEQSISQTQAQLDAANEAASTALTDQSNRDALNRQLTDSRTRLGQIDQQVAHAFISAACDRVEWFSARHSLRFERLQLPSLPDLCVDDCARHYFCVIGLQ